MITSTSGKNSLVSFIMYFPGWGVSPAENNDVYFPIRFPVTREMFMSLLTLHFERFRGTLRRVLSAVFWRFLVYFVYLFIYFIYLFIYFFFGGGGGVERNKARFFLLYSGFYLLPDGLDDQCLSITENLIT